MTPAFGTRTRLAALVVLVVVPAVLLVWAGFNLLAARESHQLAEDTRAQVARFADRVAGAGTSQDLSSVFVAASSRSLAQAELQRQVASLVERAPADLVESSVADLPQGDTAIAVDATFDLTNRSLSQLLRTIETGLPLMFVDEIAVRSLQNATATNDAEPTLRVEMRVRGQYRDGP